MVISSINGGLGNQMFQYAFGRAFSLAKGTELSVGVDALYDYSLHNGYELERLFNLPSGKASESDYRSVLGWRGSKKIRQALVRRRFAWIRGPHIFVEPHYHYSEQVLDLPKECYVVGYWQSEKYFQDCQDVIREDFTFYLPLSTQNREIKEQIDSCDAISMHIRRGDYINNQHTFNTHGVCSMNYYTKAIDFIANQCGSPMLFVFSDDMAWVKDNLKLEIPCQYLEHNSGIESYNDMRLMSMCKHHIIANSSFSWWGAWLNASPEKQVVAPKHWFNVSQFDTRDLIPDDWIKM